MPDVGGAFGSKGAPAPETAVVAVCAKAVRPDPSDPGVPSVAAVVIYSSGLVGVSPVLLIRRLLPALLTGALAALAIATLPAWR